MSNAIEEEIEMILGMYSDECERDLSEPYAIRVHLPFRFELQVIIPPNGYPEESHPSFSVLAGPNAPLISSFSLELKSRLRDEIPLGFPMLALLIPVAQEIAAETKENQEAAEQAAKNRLEAVEDEMRAERQMLEEQAVNVWAGEPMTDRRSKFVAHLARVHSVEEALDVVAYLRRQKHLATAHHPAMWAYRLTDQNGILQRDTDDDGEPGASVKMMFLLDHMGIDGYLVTVTRWWGGILLGPDRFKHIMELTKNMLLTIPEREKEMAARKAIDDREKTLAMKSKKS